MGKSVLRDKSYVFAIAIVKMVQDMQKEKKEFVLSKQVLRSGTAMGALISEAEFGQSTADFIHELSIALKEANEAGYWLNLLHDTHYIDKNTHETFSNNCSELIKLLVSSIKTLKTKN